MRRFAVVCALTLLVGCEGPPSTDDAGGGSGGGMGGGLSTGGGATGGGATGGGAAVGGGGGGSTMDDAGVDAGTDTDAGADPDAGANTDAGAASDAGEADAGSDAGAELDAGPSSDAGAGSDAGSSTDAGTVVDAGTTDAGTTDAGSVPLPVITSFMAASGTIGAGQSTTLTAVFSGGTGSVNNGVGAVTSGAAVNVTPASTTTWTLTVTNTAGQSVSATVTVTVAPLPTITSFTAARGTIGATQSTTLTAVFSGGTGSVNNGVGAVTSGTPVDVTPATTTTWTLTVTNAVGQTATASVTVTVLPQPTITSFTAARTTIGSGQSTTLTAVFSGSAAGVNNGVGTVTSGTPVTITPASTTTYTLTVTNNVGQTTTATVTVTVVPAPTIASFSAMPLTITAGTSATLTAVFANGTGSIDNGVGAVTSGAAVSVTPSTSTTYTLTVTNSVGQTVTRQASVSVVAAPVINSFTATPSSIAAGASVTLAYSSTGGTGVISNSNDGTTLSASGTSSRVVSPPRTITYTLRVTNAAGTSVTATVTVTVASVVVRPARTVQPPGQPPLTLTAEVFGTATNSVTWSTDAGTVTSAGVYTPPTSDGTYVVEARSVDFPAAFATATVEIVSGLRGTAIDRFVNAGVHTMVPRDLRAPAPRAWVPAGDGGYTAFVGVGGSDGTFGFPGLAPGVALVTLNGVDMVLVDAGVLDFGRWRAGRPDVSDAGTLSQVVLDAGGLPYWNPGGNGSDRLEFFSEGIGSFGRTWYGPTIVSGTTVSVMGTYWWYDGLVDSTRGDSFGVMKLSAFNGGGGRPRTWSYTLLSHSLILNDVLMDGGATPVVGTFGTGTSQTANLQMPIGQYWALASGGLGPGSASNSGISFYAAALPELAGGAYVYGFTLAESSLQQPTSSTNMEPVGGTWVTPLPSWGNYVSASQAYSYSLRRPDAGATITATGYINHQDTLARAQDAGFPPALNAVGSGSINGTAFRTNATLSVGLTPLISWSAPTIGPPTSYRIDLYRVAWSGGFGFNTNVLTASFRVPVGVTSLRVPPGVLAGGQDYWVSVIADRQPNSSFESQPFILSFPHDVAARVSGIFTP